MNKLLNLLKKIRINIIEIKNKKIHQFHYQRQRKFLKNQLELEQEVKLKEDKRKAKIKKWKLFLENAHRKSTKQENIRILKFLKL